MASHSLSKTARATGPTSPPQDWDDDVDDHTAPRIRAYLASVRPPRDVVNDATVDRYQRGRALIERLALSSRGTDSPRLQLTATQCADVVHFVRESEPFEPRTWFQDPRTGPSHVCGFMFVMEAVEDSLRGEKTVRGRS